MGVQKFTQSGPTCKSPDPLCADTETNWCCRMEWEGLTRPKGRNAVAEQVSYVHVCMFPFHAFLCGSMCVNICTEYLFTLQNVYNETFTNLINDVALVATLALVHQLSSFKLLWTHHCYKCTCLLSVCLDLSVYLSNRLRRLSFQVWKSLLVESSKLCGNGLGQMYMLFLT